MKKLLILDSNSLINRAFYGVRFLSSADGTPTNAIFGFMMTLMKLIDENKPDYICAAFDLPAPTFRHRMYAEYKAQRKPMPDGLRVQMPIAKDILRTMGVNILEMEGYEADDIIGTVSRICEENKTECLIATGDRDDLQLASETTKVLLTVTKGGSTETDCCDANAVFERYGVTPSEFIDVKALMGDTSDNIPGVRGIGEKTATALIARAKSIEALYADLDSFGITPANLKKLSEDKESAFLSKTLATIERCVPINFDFDENKLPVYDKNGELYDMLKRLGLNKVIARMGVEKLEAAEAVDFLNGTETEEIYTPEGFSALCEKIRKKGECACLFEMDGKSISAVAFAVDNYGARVEVSGKLSEEIFSLLRDENVKKYCVNAGEALAAADIGGICYDAAIAAYLINPARTDFSVNALSYEFLGFEFGEQKQLSLFDEAESDSAKKALAVMPICEITEKKLKENGQESLYYDVELPLVRVLADMQKQGILIDKAQLAEFSSELSLRIDELVEEIYELSGEKFNINSTKQLGEVLFEKLGLKATKKTKRGYSTGAEVLEQLRGEHPIVDAVLEYRKLMKLKSTYCDGLLAVINPDTGRIHSVFNQTVTVTGRISSTEPNMQNIPTRTELGSHIRKMFVAKQGCVLIDADYSQIELRVLAHMAQDEVMISTFRRGEDIHRVTASQVLGIPPEEVTKEQRSRAKAVNFGIVYGIGEYSLSRDLKISVKQAKAYIDGYLEKYSGVKRYMDETKQSARELGYVKTMMNRIRYVPEIASQNYNTRTFGERVAMNTPIQGSAADIIKLAMVRIYKRLSEEGFKAKLILQVHDELIIEAPLEEKETVAKILSEEMENAAALSVPLVVDMAEGNSWYDAK